VHPKQTEKANLILIAGAKNSGEWTDILPPLVVYNKDGTNTKEIDEIYRRN
jgi:tRNA1(Val) A37 N6-methylase TrmN6